MELSIVKWIPQFIVLGLITVAKAQDAWFSRLSGPVQVATRVVSDVISTSEPQCLFRCKEARCAIASWNPSSRLCQLGWSNRSTFAAGSQQVIGSDTNGERLWKSLGSESPVGNSSFYCFQNSSTGRTGVIQNFTVPITACYLIRAFGARGGSHWTVYDGSPTSTFPPKFWYGGAGAYKAGRFQFIQGTQLSIVVGQSGGNSTERTPGNPTYPEDNAGTGGGGGSFVYRSSDNYPYLAAGGGGGGSNGYQGMAGQSGIDGTSSVGSSSSQSCPGGTNGNPGTTNPPGSSYHGGPGAGWKGKFLVARQGPEHGDRGGGLPDGWVGGVSGGMNSGAVGGFGGGGGGSEDNGASGGGGGYSGGGAGTQSNQAGGGGGSFCGGVACEGVTGGNSDSDMGFVKIELYGADCS